MRQTWPTVAKELAQSPESKDQELAAEVVSFVKTMPLLKTERHEIQEKLAPKLRQAQKIQKTQNRTNTDPEQTR